ncbi:patatin, partial [Variovorax sp. 2RAF20]
VEVGLSNGRIAFPRGLIQGQKLEMLLRRLLLPTWQVRDFDRLPIPFRAVATDIVNGDKVVFAEGDLALAIRASMSV